MLDIKIREAQKQGNGDYKVILSEMYEIGNYFLNLEDGSEVTLDEEKTKSLFIYYYILIYSLTTRKWTIFNTIKRLSFLQFVNLDETDNIILKNRKRNLISFKMGTIITPDFLQVIKNDISEIFPQIEELYQEFIGSGN